eukprot:Pompholyxophrys_punicea_v1_NODE_157_length_3127_cov_12.282552.p1 type:complete len:823 gc:universal NODE_157_length_3127_cov_12.282552:2629-161(-)
MGLISARCVLCKTLQKNVQARGRFTKLSSDENGIFYVGEHQLHESFEKFLNCDDSKLSKEWQNVAVCQSCKVKNLSLFSHQSKTIVPPPPFFSPVTQLQPQLVITPQPKPFDSLPWQPELLSRKRKNENNMFTAEIVIKTANWRHEQKLPSSRAGEICNTLLDTVIINQPPQKRRKSQPYHLPADRTNLIHDIQLDYIYCKAIRKSLRGCTGLVAFWDDGKVGDLPFLVAGVRANQSTYYLGYDKLGDKGSGEEQANIFLSILNLFQISKWEFLITDGCPTIVVPNLTDLSASKCSVERIRRSKGILIFNLICFCHIIYNNCKSPMLSVIGPHPKNKRKSNNSHITLFLEDLADEIRSNSHLMQAIQSFYCELVKLIPEGVDTRWTFWLDGLKWVFAEVHQLNVSSKCFSNRFDIVALKFIEILGKGKVSGLTAKQFQLLEDMSNKWLRFQGMVASIVGEKIHRPALLWAEKSSDISRIFELHDWLEEFLIPQIIEMECIPEVVFADAIDFLLQAPMLENRIWEGKQNISKKECLDFIQLYVQDVQKDILERTEQYTNPVFLAARLGSRSSYSAVRFAKDFVRWGCDVVIAKVAEYIFRPSSDVLEAMNAPDYCGIMQLFINGNLLWKQVELLAVQTPGNWNIWNSDKFKVLRNFLIQTFGNLCLHSVEAEEGVKFVKRELSPQQRNPTTGSRIMRLRKNVLLNRKFVVQEKDFKEARSVLGFSSSSPKPKKNHQVQQYSLDNVVLPLQNHLKTLRTIKKDSEEAAAKKEKEHKELVSIPDFILKMTVSQLKQEILTKEPKCRLPILKHDLRLKLGALQQSK